MCGIFGYLIMSGNTQANQPTFSWRHLWNSLYTIKGRGPDNMQLKQIGDNLVLGFQRLRINDCSSAGDQPLHKGKISVACNGEIYNFKDLKEKYDFKFESGCDCEVLLHMYEKFGDVGQWIDELDGVFAFAIHDGNTGEVFLGRDAIGVRPIFMGQDEHGNYGFASEAKALLNVVKPDTLKSFPPGSWWSSKTLEYTKWWNPETNLETVDLETYDEDAVLKETGELIYKAVCKRMMSDRPIGTFLSGGLDSSIVAALIKKFHIERGHQDTNLNTFSIGLEGSPDLAYAEIVAKHINSTHHHVEIQSDDCVNAVDDVVYATETFDVTTIRASTPMYLLSKYIRHNTSDVVIYSGEGADEVTQGYLYFKKQPSP